MPSDLIEHDGEDMRNRPFLERKAALARLVRNSGAGILFDEHINEDGPIVFAHACRLGVEGIVSKKVDSTYRSGRCPAWIKVCRPTLTRHSRRRIRPKNAAESPRRAKSAATQCPAPDRVQFEDIGPRLQGH
jgi:hypothetical protein